MRILQKSLKIANDIFPNHYDTKGVWRPYHFAFIYKRNQLISIGVNRPYNPDAKTLYLANKFNVQKYKKYNYAHAETDAISKCWGKVHLNSSFSIVVLRLNKYGELGQSKPCTNCQQILDAIGIKKIWWSTKDGNIVNE